MANRMDMQYFKKVFKDGALFICFRSLFHKVEATVEKTRAVTLMQGYRDLSCSGVSSFFMIRDRRWGLNATCRREQFSL